MRERIRRRRASAVEVRGGLPVPDLLQVHARLGVDQRALEEILGLAFLGRPMGTQVHDTLAKADTGDSTWNPEFFADDLFLKALIEHTFTIQFGGRDYPVNRPFMERALRSVPIELETIRFRQGILIELDQSDKLLTSVRELYAKTFDFLSLTKSPGYGASLDAAAFRLDVLRQAKSVIDLMHSAFADSRSGLRRIHESAEEIRQGPEYRALAGLLAYEQQMAKLRLDVTIGGDGRIRHVDVLDAKESEDNPFYRNPLSRFFERLRLLYRGYPMSQRELMNRLIDTVFQQLSPYLVPLVQLLGHLEFYLAARTFRDKAQAAGLEVSLASFESDGGPVYRELFNPLLLALAEAPVPCTVAPSSAEPITVITGPNSGGKTRLLQALGLTQVLGQSGLYVPCAGAQLKLCRGLFVSLIEDESAEQTEGRLGRELVRIRSLFEQMEEGSMVILDELCSGTNPSEGVEVFAMVLRLLRRVRPAAFVTTHFLDFARSLETEPIVSDLEFLQVEVDGELRSTYQFTPGVAATSLAAMTAQRLGVTFERLSSMINRPEDGSEPPDRGVEAGAVTPAVAANEVGRD